MTISSSMNAGVAGLNVNASKLATIADNIANSKTYGYKRVDADFTAMTLPSQKGKYTAGGVRVTTYREVTAQGALVSTGNSTDIAVGGRGMLPVTSASSLGAGAGPYPLMMTATGSFRPDSSGILRSESGLVLLGWPAAPNGTIPVQSRDSSAGLLPVDVTHNQFAADPTTWIGLGINLPANATAANGSGDSMEISLEYFDNLGSAQTMTAVFTPQVPGAGQSNLWTMEVIDLATSTAPIAEFAVQFDATTGLGGAILSVTPVYGGTYDAATGELDVTFDRGPMSLSIGAPGTSAGLTQLSDQFAPITLEKNGAPTGNVTSVEIDANGFVSANYDSGYSRIIFQVPLVDVANPNAMEPSMGQSFTATRGSGQFFLWNAGDGPTGSTIGYALQESTTDIAGELTALIQTQRAYASNAKIIQTVDEMLQETTNIKR